MVLTIQLYTKITVQPISNLMLTSTDSQVNSFFLCTLLKLACLMFILACLITHTRKLDILVSLLACTQAGVINML